MTSEKGGEAQANIWERGLLSPPGVGHRNSAITISQRIFSEAEAAYRDACRHGTKSSSASLKILCLINDTWP